MKNHWASLIDKIKKQTIINTLLVGLIGSALWDWIVSPLSNVIFERLLSFSGNLITAISDNIYKQISNGYTEQSSQLVLIFLISFALALFWLLTLVASQMHLTAQEDFEDFQLIRSTFSNENTSFEDSPNTTEDFLGFIEDSEKLARETLETSKKNILKVTLAIIPSSLFLLWIVMQTTYVNSTITTLTNNIEIVSPYISDLEYRHLKSSFHQMDSRADYDDLCETLIEIAETNNLTLK